MYAIGTKDWQYQSLEPKYLFHETDISTLIPKLSGLVVWFHQLSPRSLQSPNQYDEIAVVNGEPPATMPIV
jgi:hypothetical protein